MNSNKDRLLFPVRKDEYLTVDLTGISMPVTYDILDKYSYFQYYDFFGQTVGSLVIDLIHFDHFVADMDVDYYDRKD